MHSWPCLASGAHPRPLRRAGAAANAAPGPLPSDLSRSADLPLVICPFQIAGPPQANVASLDSWTGYVAVISGLSCVDGGLPCCRCDGAAWRCDHGSDRGGCASPCACVVVRGVVCLPLFGGYKAIAMRHVRLPKGHNPHTYDLPADAIVVIAAPALFEPPTIILPAQPVHAVLQLPPRRICLPVLLIPLGLFGPQPCLQGEGWHPAESHQLHAG